MSGRGWEFMKQLIEGLGGVDQVGGELACLGDVELCAIADPDRHGGVDGAVGVLPAVDLNRGPSPTPNSRP